MRFIVMAIRAGDEPGAREAVAKMIEYNRSLQKAGVLLALDELFPSSTAAHISYLDGKPLLTEGRSGPAQEAIGAYWILQVRSREEAIEWAKRAPMSNHERIEVRQIHGRLAG